MSEARVSALYRHPVKGFSPEPIEETYLTQGEAFPYDRIYAIEDGPSGFNSDTPAHMSKFKFTVLARDAGLAKLKTCFDDASSVFWVDDGRGIQHRFMLEDEDGRRQLAAFISEQFGTTFSNPLKVLKAVPGYRFTDSSRGHVSLLNLSSLDALSGRVGQAVSPLRFRMNVSLEGLEAWAEDEWTESMHLSLGDAVLEVVKPTVRCKATHADPLNGEYNLDVVPALKAHFDRLTLGFYTRVVKSGTIRIGDRLIRHD